MKFTKKISFHLHISPSENFSKLPQIVLAYLVFIPLNAVYGEYPWQALVEVLVPDNATRITRCGGSLVTNQHVVTVSNHSST